MLSRFPTAGRIAAIFHHAGDAGDGAVTAGHETTGRTANQAAVACYAHAMQSGEWVLNGMPLIVSRKGVLLDGVQRLYACMDAAVPFVTVLAENISDDTVHTIDQQRRRSFTGVLETRGIPHPAAVANYSPS